MAFRTAYCLFIVFIAASAAATPYSPTYDYGFDAAKLVKRQTQEPILVSKLPSINGSVPIRLEIRQMKQNPYKWNLFVLSMSMLQYTNQNDELSWYQIAGEYLSSSILFRLVQTIATLFTDPSERALYHAAAVDWRIPYWDWAMQPPTGEAVFLPEFESPGIQIYGPNGWQYIANPLHSYQFKPLDPKVFSEGDFPTWTETKRAPYEIADNHSIAQSIEHARPALQQRLYTLLSNYKDYGPFSNKYWGTATNQSQFDSVEALHDAMHVLVGARGHMFYIQYSAFEPMFFLHHTMVDRIITLWQALYPTSWVVPQVAMEHSFTMPPGTVQDVLTDLKPFFANTSGAFWNSAMARDTLPFGYAYAETSPTPGSSRAEDRARLISAINRLYGSSSPSTLVQKRRTALSSRDRGPFTPIRKGTVLADGFTDFSREPQVASKLLNNDNVYTEWIANVHVQNGALNGSFSIHFFIGQTPQDSSSWSAAPNLVGSMDVFAMKNMGSGNHMSGTVPLTSALMHMVAAGGVAGLDPGQIEPYLKTFLQVRVVAENGKVVQPRSIDSLYIQIASSEVQAARNEWELPSWGPVVARFELDLA
ncbi:tyrosinase precursor [Colletotrichum karsti]|uniref:Tyrosinase n=1 Tax=Colletotrichum karsti TaxID=1095194 RepID=A0A9P6I9U5_9PEZI|nr:tyrosinase precursor [Colletotrichum karsti]KAF9878973.1 tyrosinase precursor [Colletotrichum karsti]